MELDSHADTCTLGSVCLVLQETGRTVDVSGFTQGLGTKDDIKVVTGAVAYDCPLTHVTYILVFHEALYIPEMDVHLLNPFQMRNQGVVVNETPLHQLPVDQRTSDSHSIICPEVEPTLHIPMVLDGVMSGFTVRKPTWEEVTNTDLSHIHHVHMTSSQPWDPSAAAHSELEGTLRTDMAYQEPRHISHIRVRGQDQEVPTDADCIWVEGSEEFKYEDIKSMSDIPKERRHLAALDCDRYADLLLKELGVKENGMIDDDSKDQAQISATTTVKKKHGFVDAETLAANWKIGKEAAKRTIEATTQLAVRDFTHTSGGRRLKPLHWVLNQPRLQCEVYCDIFMGRCKSLRGNICAQIFATPFHFVRAFPMKHRKLAHESLDEFFQQVGIPQVIIPDNAKELTQGEFRKKCKRAQCPIHPIEAYTSNANLAESVIRELMRHYTRTMTDKNPSEVVWDYCLEWCSLIRSHTALNIRLLNGQVPATKMTGDTCDISFLAEFGFYDWVWYVQPKGERAQEDTSEPSLSRKKLGRYLGPSLSVGDAMCGTVLTEIGTRLERTSIIPLSPVDHNDDSVKNRMGIFNDVLKSKLKDRVRSMKEGKEPSWLDEIADMKDVAQPTPEHVEYEGWDPSDLGYALEEEKPPLPEIKEADDLDLNNYISAKVMLPKDGHSFASGRVVRRLRDENGELIGKSNNNPLLDTAQYEVEFEDGAVERYHANIIAEHIYSQMDDEGNGVALLDEIIDHKREATAISKEDGYVTGRNGVKKPKQTTVGWKLLVKLKDHTTVWIKLKDLKESNPLELAQYASDNQLVDEPAFKWWVPFTLRRRNRILKTMSARYHKTNTKFGIEVPSTVKRALEIDQETGTTFWRDAIEKEMKTVMVAFDVKEEGAPKPLGYKFIKCHLIFTVKQGTLQRKARFVADGSRVEADVPTYASVVSRESVRIAFTLAALNGLDILAADCEGAYLNATTRERLYTKCGPEFGPELEGRWAIIVRALYGSRSAAASWRATISSIVEGLGFSMCRADNDVWMREGVNAAGEHVWEYVLVYSDDLLIIGLHPDQVASKIDQHCKLKHGSVKEPDQYLGADIGKMHLPNGDNAWTMSSDGYCKAAIQNVETWLAAKDALLPTKAACVFPSGWKPETDVTDLLCASDVSYYQQQVGVLRWMVELGRIDIGTEVSMLAAYSAAPRQGHLAAILHLFAYLKKNPKSKMVFDPSNMEHDPQEAHDWSDFYNPQEEPKPSDMPSPRGRSMQITAFVDSDHAGDLVNRRSRTGVIIFCGRSPIVFHTKKQGSIETSSFGSELSAMKTAVELLEGLRYKLRMMGVPIDGPAYVKADNMSVVHNCSNPASMLKKKSNSIAYHYVRERCAGGVCNISYVPTDLNVADMLTKSQPGEVRRRLAEMVLY